jgi:hypothetical protein
MIVHRQGEASMKTIVSVLACAFVVCVQGQALAQSSLNGTWRGMGHQSSASGAGSDWSIAMTIKPDGSSIDYPSLSCGGTLTQVSRTDTSAEFREHITYGQKSCIDGGTVTIRLQNGQLAWTWFGTQSGKLINASAVLGR